MKTTGVIRKLDELGRITLPIELRRSLDLDVKDGLEITVQDDCIILKKAECADIFTGSTDDLLEYEGKKVSRQSVVALAKLAGLNVTEQSKHVHRENLRLLLNIRRHIRRRFSLSLCVSFQIILIPYCLRPHHRSCWYTSRFVIPRSLATAFMASFLSIPWSV